MLDSMLCEKVHSFQERIEKLESEHLDQLSPYAFLVLKVRIDKIENILEKYLKPNTRDDLDRLEQRFSVIELKISELKTHSNFTYKKPFTCPVCDGSGAVNIMNENMQCRIPRCTPCEGKGIVWSS